MDGERPQGLKPAQRACSDTSFPEALQQLPNRPLTCYGNIRNSVPTKLWKHKGMEDITSVQTLLHSISLRTAEYLYFFISIFGLNFGFEFGFKTSSHPITYADLEFMTTPLASPPQYLDWSPIWKGNCTSMKMTTCFKIPVPILHMIALWNYFEFIYSFN